MRTKTLLISFVNSTALIFLCPISAKAITVAFDNWTLGTPTISKSSSYAGGIGIAKPNLLQAIAAASVDAGSPSSYFSENATVNISASSFFTVNPTAAGEEVGQQVDGFLIGHLKGIQGAAGFDIFGLTGTYNASVQASVNAGFASWTSPAPGTSMSGSVLVLDAVRNPIYININVPGILQIGQRYPFAMELTTSVSKSGAYQVVSQIQDLALSGDGFTATVSATPVPWEIDALPVIGSTVIFGLGLWSKQKFAQHQKDKKD